jgi:hypothetical protein
MASKDIINPVDVNNPSLTRRSADLLPTYHRTDRNTKFLASTLDQFIQPAQIKRVNGFIGSKLSPNYDPETDEYIDGTTKLRNDYQLEPSLIIEDLDVDNSIRTAVGYDDLINKLAFDGANVSNLDRLFRPESYSYNPHIDWDKFINFRQYYWMPTGPDTIEIVGKQKATISTYKVKDSKDGNTLIFTPDGATTNPLLTLYRGLTYVFNVDSKYPFYVKTAYTSGVTSLYSGTTSNGTKVGQVIVTIDEFTPNTLFYYAEGNPTAVGQFSVQSITEDTFLDLEKDVLGKQTYQSGNGVNFSNGMKVRFAGNVIPETYLDKDWFVEGVGSAITLVDYSTLQTVGIETTNLNVNFDATAFDEYPFDDFRFVPLTPEYLTINRAAIDQNPWSKYNRWVHQDVITATAKANGVQAIYDSALRATRPIIEFVAGLQLHNFGAIGKNNVDVIDNTTIDAFRIVENSPGYYVDSVQLEAGMRVIFNADKDHLVRGKVYEVKIAIVNNQPRINLEEVLDSTPLINEAVIVAKGTTYAGSCWWFNGSTWIFGQQKSKLNQAPLFEVYDESGNRYADQSVYNSTFSGTKIFGYEVGTVDDAVLGFKVAYRNIANIGEFVFKNYFMTDIIEIFVGGTVETQHVSDTFLKLNTSAGSSFATVWTKTIDRPIPILQYQVVEADTVSIEITAINNAGYTSDLKVDVFVNDVKQILNTDVVKITDGNRAYIVSTTTFSANDRVLFKLYTSKTPIGIGYYEAPINLTNNPLNGSIESFTLTEISDHVKTMTDANLSFAGVFPGSSNLRDLSDISHYGSRLVSHMNPISFAHYFIGGESNDDLITAIRTVAADYNQFKASLLKNIAGLKGLYTPAQSLDTALRTFNATKDDTFSYNNSDMIAHGKDCLTRTFTVTDTRHLRYSIASIFNDTVLGTRALLVYLNGVILTKGYDYVVNQFDPSITMLITLARGDVLTILDFPNTASSFIPPTPTKLGLFPKFKPAIYFDNTYVGEPRKVIQGHDGSITIAFNDYRDDVLLEYETRVYNNLKTEYNTELLDINTVLPGAFRDNAYSKNEITSLVTSDFLRWAGYYGVDYQTNSTFDELNSFTFNYTGSIDTIAKNPLNGFWRGIYKYFYDTDRPHTHPWEMLGFTEQPSWWVSTYGTAPYTSGNLVLWNDLEAGRSAITGETNSLYARPGLSKIIPVDESGNLRSPSGDAYVFNSTTNTAEQVSQNKPGLATTPILNLNDPNRIVMLRSEQIAARWAVGDQGPAETAWRRSSWWPFACQVLMMLAKPATYSAVMFDPSRMKKNISGEYKYGIDNEFLNPSKVSLFNEIVNSTPTMAAGYSVFVVETGAYKNSNYITQLRGDLDRVDYRLMAKLGAFASKDKLSVGIDAVDPTSPYPGVLIPSQDYQIFSNKSSPIESLGISGIIIQKTNTGWTIRGYDKYCPYFTILKPFTSNVDQIERVGGVSESFVTWNPNTTYNESQVLFYAERYYRVKQKHNSGATFAITYYQSLPYLPTVGGVGVLRRTAFDTTETRVAYGTEYRTHQEMYDLIVGYGKWLESKGFVFDEFNDILGQILDWKFTAKEFLYWTTQNWAVNAVITLSPFANKLILKTNNGIVDSIVNNFYEYSLLKADGSPFPKHKFTIVRLDGEFAISTIDTQEGLFFARLNVVQKEHAVVMNNFTLFNDVVYDVDTGYRQRRIKVKGFITDNWNGDFFSPGFVFDQAKITEWKRYTDYNIGDVVRFSGNYYSAIKSISGVSEFNITQWAVLNEKPVSQLLPNFDYKINQFEDFYSLDIDNFDVGQQAMAQHLIGYTPRPYLNFIIGDPIAQYKFYQGFIRDKGSRNSLDNLAKASVKNLRSSVDFSEEWALRIGSYGGYTTYHELEINLESNKFLANPQVVEFVENKPTNPTDIVYYKNADDVIIKPSNFDITSAFATTTDNATDVFKYPVAGYVRFDDITSTAYNKNSVLDIANNGNLSTGDTVWLGFREDGEWDVLRVTDLPTYVSAVEVNVPGQSMIITTYYAHQLNANDLISVTGVASGIDQCYIVQEILNVNQILVLSTITTLPALTNPVAGLIFAFKSSRLSTFNDLSNIAYLDRWAYGENIWVDNDGTGKFAVYKKTDNYQAITYNSEVNNVIGQHYGSRIATNDDTNLVIVSAPDYTPTSGSDTRGRLFVLYKDSFGELQMRDNFAPNDRNGTNFYTIASGHEPTGYGQSLKFNPDTTLIAAGAPLTSRVFGVFTGTNQVNPGAASQVGSATEVGIVKLSILNTASYQILNSTVAVTSPRSTSTTGTYFGQSIALSSIASTTTQKLLVGAPDLGITTGSGAAYMFTVNVTLQGTSSTVAVSTSTELLHIPKVSAEHFGYSVTGNRELTRVAISALLYDSGNTSRGAVYIYDLSTSTSYIQIITGDDLSNPMGEDDLFANAVEMSKDGQFLIVASPYAYDPNLGTRTGVVDTFIWNSTTKQFDHNQRISTPISAISSNTLFAYDISLNDTADTLVITTIGTAKANRPTFDKFSDSTSVQYVNDPTSAERSATTLFDGGGTKFYSNNTEAGTAHVYNRVGTTSTKWSYAQNLTSNDVESNSKFGACALALTNSVYIGAPAQLASGANGKDSGIGQMFVFDKINTAINSWALHRSQSPLVDLAPIKRAITVDTNSEQISEYIDVIDPIKGNILGTAAQDLRYTTSYDPAVYSLGITGVNVDANTNWLDEHVGELWWDLSTVKFVWYEQGEIEYRKNTWNNLFPGSSIDVYEWVRSEYLPAEWSQLADTAEGLTKGISGQPKFNDNSIISVKQVYSSVSNAFTNVYYFWVKNKISIPSNVRNRRKAAFEIAQEIADPTGSGSKFLSVISPTTMILANAKSAVASEQINLNIATDTITDAANRHTEWALVAENDSTFNVTAGLIQKLIDSLLGHDSIGNLVPDHTLPEKLRYGVSIRPRQSMFKDRGEALRNLVEFINSVIINELLVGQVDFTALNSVEETPSSETYDVQVEDLFNLELIVTRQLVTAELSAEIDSNGSINRINIDNPGFGYISAPTITIDDSGTGAEVRVNINEFGSVTSVDIVNAGKNYTADIAITARPYTVLVLVDAESANRWAMYEWNASKSLWIKMRTQSYDTTQYWEAVDWASSTYNPLTPVSTAVAAPYALEVLVSALNVGTYVKVQNGGDGRYLILSKTDGTHGTFDTEWNLEYSEKGTIQFLDSLWNTSGAVYAWDQRVGFDQVRYDQLPDKELEFIIDSVLNDIFTGSRFKYQNSLFFKAVRYAMSEQKFLDWAFKTTFISATNNAGSLDQPASYLSSSSVYYEQFLNEIKPYHTKIRKFTELYTSTELTQTFNTDFDLPVYYNTATLNFNKVEFGNNLLLQYPWKSWYQNYAYQVDSIDIYDGGDGYNFAPSVTIVPAFGDTGRGATAVAFVSLGKISRIIVTNPGQGYTATPTVILNGGGSTTLTPARAYAQLGNSPVRSNLMQLRFDRTTKEREVGNQYFTQQFISNGVDTTLELDWAPLAQKELITLTRNGILQLIDAFTIIYDRSVYNPQPNTEYTKLSATLKLLFNPGPGDIIEITFPKSLDLYNAASRIEDYYEPTAGMPGKNLAQLMSGVEYSGLQVIGLPFDSAGGWDAPGIAWAQNPWDNFGEEAGYTSYLITDNVTTSLAVPTLVTLGTELNVYTIGANDSSKSGKRIDGVSTSSLVKTLIGKGTGAVDSVEMIIPGAGYIEDYTSISISAPNTLGGTQAQISATIVSGAISIDVVNPGSGYTEAPVITIVESINPSHTVTSVIIQAYARAVLRAEFTEIGSTATTSTITIPDVAFTTTSTLVVLRYSTSDGTVLPTDQDSLDAVISGGDLSMSTALGVSPSEIVLDGGSTSTRHITGMNDDGFLNPINSHAPEECVPGQIQEAIGISVFTQPASASPIITNKRYYVNGSTRTFKMGIRPVNAESVLVLFNNQRYTANNYTIDYAENTFTFNSVNPGTGWLSITTMQLGTVQLLDTLTASTSSNKTVLTSSVSFRDVGSVYVTVDGIKVEDPVYTLTSYRGAARITVNQAGTIQAYLFKGESKSFSEITEQTMIASISTATVFSLNPLPGNAEPFHSQVIVTKNGAKLKPPITTYWQVAEGQTTFDISNSILYPLGRIDLSKLEVYVNGSRVLPARNWKLGQEDNQIEFRNKVLKTGDVVAVVIKEDQDYLIQNGTLVLSSPAATGAVISVITFTNHDPDFIRTERFNGSGGNQYTMQRSIIDASYVWVTYNGNPLTVNLDYTLSSDKRTVIIREGFYQNASDTVLVTSFADTEPMVAYRLFRDMLGRTHYKRLSQPDSTILAQDLLLTDTIMAVEDASLLTQPDPAHNRPGVVLINGERIEFFSVQGNVLHQLRRSTLGTAPADVHYAGDLVTDYGANQTIQSTETLQRFTTATTTATAQYEISGITFVSDALYTDQVEVRYQGMPLLKPGLTTVIHNPEIAYDSTSTADAVVPYGFDISTTTGILTLNTATVTLVAGARLEVIKRSARMWYETSSTMTLAKNNTVQAKFLAGTPAIIPRYLSSSTYIKADITLTLETLLELTDETNNPLEGI